MTFVLAHGRLRILFRYARSDYWLDYWKQAIDLIIRAMRMKGFPGDEECFIVFTVGACFVLDFNQATSTVTLISLAECSGATVNDIKK